MLEKLHWLGHDAFRLDASKIIYFDPFKLSPQARKADIILITHEHFDHYSPADVALLSTKDTLIITDKAVAQKVRSANFAYGQLKALSPGESFSMGGFDVIAVASYNIGKQFHLKESGKLGYIVKIDGVSLYHAGDTDLIPEMKNIKADIALLPVSGIYVMTAEEAAQAALLIKPGIAIPMHYGAGVVGQLSDAQQFEKLLKGKVEVRILKKEE